METEHDPAAFPGVEVAKFDQDVVPGAADGEVVPDRERRNGVRGPDHEPGRLRAGRRRHVDENIDLVGDLERDEIDGERRLQLHARSVAVTANGLTTGYGQVRFTTPAATDAPLFRPRDDAALQRLDDDALIAYMREARTNGHPSAGHALAILVYGHWRNVERRMRMKIPAAHVEDLTGDVVADAIASAFEGKSIGEFRSWLNTITQRAIADYYRRGAGRIKTAHDAAPEPATDPDTGEVEVRDAIERVMAKLRPEHQKVVDLVVFEGCSAAEAAQAVPGMTEANVHQIVSRFRRALRGELEAGGDTD